ncbi:MAG TPA: LLM class flavin-dependent oxidoreductase [Sphingobium sp.]|nr:LLM class flavin-dependent oxidoreductase [Sphingobium sp.]
MVSLSFLDQSPAIEGVPHTETIRETVAYARACEAMGFHRYWLAEHHNSLANIGTAPEILVAAIAATTSRIRVGSAGVLLSHYAPLKVAEQFRVLEALAPGRIDLGLGRSPGGSEIAAKALRRGTPPEFDLAVAELLDWLMDAGHSDHPGVQALPTTPGQPEPWILSSSPRGAALAAKMGLPYCFNISHGQNHHQADEAVAYFRTHYRPSARFPQPLLSLAVWALAADSDDEARFLYGPRALWRVQLDRGVRSGLLSPDQITKLTFTDEEQQRIDHTLSYSFVGSAARVGRQLDALIARHQPDELVMTCWTHDAKDRQRSCALVAQQLGVAKGET